MVYCDLREKEKKLLAASSLMSSDMTVGLIVVPVQEGSKGLSGLESGSCHT